MSFDLDAPMPVLQDSLQQRVWSPLQAACFDAALDPKRNILIEAVAGSGKTTTAMELMKRSFGSSVYLAFNAEIAKETRAKYPGYEVKTFNAFGHAMWKMAFPYSTLDIDKDAKIFFQAVGKDSPLTKYTYAVTRAVGLAKGRAWGLGKMVPSALEFEELLDTNSDVPAEDLSTVSELARTVFLRSCAELKTFSFDDQLYMPVKMGWSFPVYSNVLVDECQDLNPIQHLMLQKLHDKGARIIAVGDRRQAIYAFRGALSDSMDLLKSRFQMDEFPLSVTYRCPVRVVLEAQTICPQIQPRLDAKLGDVVWREYAQDERGETFIDDPQLFTSYQLVVCRNNAPLFRAILRHIRANSPCKVKTNFLDNFQGFLRSFKEADTLGLLLKLDSWYEREKAAAEAKGFKGKVAGLTDKYETVKLLCDQHSRTEDVIRMIKRLQECTWGPTFSTIHKAKGLEAPHVYLLRPDLIPAIYAESEEQIAQEMNLRYVGITRAQETFTYGVRW